MSVIGANRSLAILSEGMLSDSQKRSLTLLSQGWLAVAITPIPDETITVPRRRNFIYVTNKNFFSKSKKVDLADKRRKADDEEIFSIISTFIQWVD